MLRLIALFLVTLAALTVPAAAPSVAANARMASFLDAEHPNDTYWGVSATDKQLMDIGRTACAFYSRGMGDLDVLTAMVGGPSMVAPAGSEAREKGLQRVRNAKRFLCP